MKSPLPGAPCDQCTKSDDIWQQISCSTHDGQHVRHQFLKSKDDNDMLGDTTTIFTSQIWIQRTSLGEKTSQAMAFTVDAPRHLREVSYRVSTVPTWLFEGNHTCWVFSESQLGHLVILILSPTNNQHIMQHLS